MSWKPDPYAVEIIDAFSMECESYMYIFPPFSLIGRIVQKIILNTHRSRVMIIVPYWTINTVLVFTAHGWSH